MLEKLYYPKAREMARQGATRGMIIRKLQDDEQLTRRTAAEIADHVLSAVAMRTRILGAAQSILGLATVGGGVFVFLFWKRHRVAIGMGMFGVILFGIGLVNVTHRRSPSKPRQDEVL